MKESRQFTRHDERDYDSNSDNKKADIPALTRRRRRDSDSSDNEDEDENEI